jgi:hypothetical protein
MNPALKPLIKLLARIAVEDYLNELRQTEKPTVNNDSRPTCIPQSAEHVSITTTGDENESR